MNTKLSLGVWFGEDGPDFGTIADGHRFVIADDGLVDDLLEQVAFSWEMRKDGLDADAGSVRYGGKGRRGVTGPHERLSSRLDDAPPGLTSPPPRGECCRRPVAGLIAHVAGPTAVGWRIIDVWESEEDYHRFETERLHPALKIATSGQTPPSRPFESFPVNSVNGLGRRG